MTIKRAKKPNKKLAVVDIGSNSVRLVIYDTSRKLSKPLAQHKVVCGLALGMTERHPRLNVKGTKLALRTLKKFSTIIDKFAPDHIVAIGTAAMRKAKKTPQGLLFHQRAEAALGHKIKIISGKAEAELSARGMLQSWPRANGICADLGGGSLELIRIENGVVKRSVSLPIGSLTLLSETDGNLTATRAIVQKRLARFDWLESEGHALYAIGGSWRAVGRIFKHRTGKIHGFRITAARADIALNRLSAANALHFKQMHKKIRQRANTIPIAALVMHELLDKTAASRVVFVGQGLREGAAAAALTK